LHRVSDRLERAVDAKRRRFDVVVLGHGEYVKRYVIEERVGDQWIPANLPESPYTDDRGRALGILAALGSRRFRVRDTSSVQVMLAQSGRPIYIARSRVAPNARARPRQAAGGRP
jgi:hypothetical protein